MQNLRDGLLPLETEFNVLWILDAQKFKLTHSPKIPLGHVQSAIDLEPVHRIHANFPIMSPNESYSSVQLEKTTVVIIYGNLGSKKIRFLEPLRIVFLNAVTTEIVLLF